MSIVTSKQQAIIETTVSIAVGVAISASVFVVLNTFIWSWLALILSLIASYFIETAEPVVAAKTTLAGYAGRGCGWLANKFVTA